MVELFRAVKSGDSVAVGIILRQNAEAVHARDKEGSTLLHWAAWKGHAEVAALLLDAGADIHARSNNSHWGDTPLHAAAHGNHRAAAELLIARGADVNALDPDGHSPLDETKAHNATAVAKLLRQSAATLPSTSGT